MDRKAAAAALHAKGYNCSQAIACAFADRVAMSEEDLFRVMEGFGLGMGGMRGTCGAISGAVAIVGLMNSKGSADVENKTDTYRIVKQIATEFEKRNGVSTCHELKGVESGHMIRRCSGCINDVVEILETVLDSTFPPEGEE